MKNKSLKVSSVASVFSVTSVLTPHGGKVKNERMNIQILCSM